MTPFVVIDTNIWIDALWLRSGVGAAVLNMAARGALRLVVPEVVRLEVLHHLVDEVKTVAADATQAHSRLLALHGEAAELQLPPEEELTKRAGSFFERLGVDWLDLPMDLDAARSSLMRCVRGEAPSGPKNQQFKDGVLWANCVKLAAQAPVKLVTKDRGFFADDKSLRLAPVLAAEAQACAHKLELLRDLSGLLGSSPPPVDIDLDGLEGSVLDEWTAQMEHRLRRRQVVRGARLERRVNWFAVEDPATLLAQFSFSYRCEGLPDARLLLEGEARCRVGSGELVGLLQTCEELSWAMPDGTRQSDRVVFASGAAFLGVRQLHRTIRFPISSAGG